MQDLEVDRELYAQELNVYKTEIADTKSECDRLRKIAA
jgi:hypothetical protein